MKLKILISLITLAFLTTCVGTSSTGIFGTGVTIAMDPRTLGTQIDDSIMDKSLDTKLISKNKAYILNVKTKIIDGRIFITGKVDTVEEKLNITKSPPKLNIPKTDIYKFKIDNSECKKNAAASRTILNPYRF